MLLPLFCNAYLRNPLIVSLIHEKFYHEVKHYLLPKFNNLWYKLNLGLLTCWIKAKKRCNLAINIFWQSSGWSSDVMGELVMVNLLLPEVNHNTFFLTYFVSLLLCESLLVYNHDSSFVLLISWHRQQSRCCSIPLKSQSKIISPGQK